MKSLERNAEKIFHHLSIDFVLKSRQPLNVELTWLDPSVVRELARTLVDVDFRRAGFEMTKKISLLLAMKPVFLALFDRHAHEMSLLFLTLCLIVVPLNL